MTHFMHRRRAAFLLFMSAALLVPAAGRAAEEGSGPPSLRMIPAEAAFYSVSLRNREQIEAITKSKAWAKFNSLPLVQMAWKQVQAQLAKPDPQLAEILKLYEMPENKELVALLGEMMSDEVYCYGGDSLANLLELFSRVQNANQFNQLNVLIKKKAAGDGAPTPAVQQARGLLNALRDNMKLIQVPELVFGFRVKDTKTAETQLKRLEEVLEPLMAQAPPPLKDRLQKIKVKGKTFLSLALDGKMVPWDRIPIADVEEKEGEYKDLVKKLTGLKLSISLGVRDNYVLLAIGESLDALERLGGKGAKLADRPELKPLAKFADKKIASVGYVSKDLMSRVMTKPEDIDALAEIGKQFLESSPLAEAQRKRAAKDIDALAKDVKSVLIEPGAIFGFSFLTDNGQESYSYNHMKVPGKVQAEPLTLLNHVGGNPIFALIGRSAYEPQRYQSCVKWIKILYSHAEEFGLSQVPEGGKEAYQQVSKLIFPLLNRLDEITGKMLLPALADGQMALVLDAKWKSKKWHMMAPGTPAAMPLPEFALVLGVSDAALLTKSMAEYRKLVNDALVVARQLSQGQVPEIQAPPPQTEEGKGGTLFFYPIPEILGLDKQVTPTAGLGEKVAVLALSKESAERLLASKPLKVESGPLADPKKPLLAAVYFNWPALVDAATPWVEFGVQMATMRGGAAIEGKRGGPKPEEILEQAQALLEILKVYKGSTSGTYQEDGVTVTHTETVVHDLK